MGPSGGRGGGSCSGVGNGDQLPSKHGHKSEYHSHGTSRPCAVWVALGSEGQYAHLYKRESTLGIEVFSLKFTSVPTACRVLIAVYKVATYSDCWRATSTPRWVKLQSLPLPRSIVLDVVLGGVLL